VTVEETPQHRDRKALAAIGDQPLPDLEQRNVRAAPDQAQEIVAMRLDPAGAGAGEISPVVLNRFTQRTALAMLTLKRAAA
jgi:hypothetical protein